MEKETLEIIANEYGLHSQCRQAVEEMAELTQAITKFWRYKGVNQVEINQHRENIIEELADVEIMILQLKYLFKCENAVEKIKAEKVERELGRMIARNDSILRRKVTENIRVLDDESTKSSNLSISEKKSLKSSI